MQSMTRIHVKHKWQSHPGFTPLIPLSPARAIPTCLECRSLSWTRLIGCLIWDSSLRLKRWVIGEHGQVQSGSCVVENTSGAQVLSL